MVPMRVMVASAPHLGGHDFGQTIAGPYQVRLHLCLHCCWFAWTLEGTGLAFDGNTGLQSDILRAYRKPAGNRAGRILQVHHVGQIQRSVHVRERDPVNHGLFGA